MIKGFLQIPTNIQQMKNFRIALKIASEGNVVKKFPKIPDDGDEESYANLAREQRLLEKEQAAQASSAKDSDAG